MGPRCWAGSCRARQVVVDHEALFLALGILGATVMPHNLYLHSSIIQTRNFARDDTGRREDHPLRDVGFQRRAGPGVLHQRRHPDLERGGRFTTAG